MIVLEVFVFNLIDCAFAVEKYTSGVIDKSTIAIFFSISLLIQFLTTAHYLLAAKRIWLAKIFNCIQTMILTVAMTEKALLSGSSDTPDLIYVALLSIITSISFMGTF